MKARALRVPRDEAERLRRQLRLEGLLRADVRIRSEGESVLLPVVDRHPLPEGLGSPVEVDLDEAPRRPAPSYRALLSLSDEEAAALPRAFDVVGEIVLIRLPRELEARGAEIGEALLAFVPGARLVGLDRGVAGAARVRRLERLAGHGPWRTVHHENGLQLDVDLERAYFSPRLAREHLRVAEASGSGERIFDLCCGVGPFALLLARRSRPRELVAVDSNPEAIALLKESARRNGLEGRIEPLEQPVEAFLRSGRRAGRIIFNLPTAGVKYLPQVSTALEPSGMLHYYEVTERAHLPSRGSELAQMLSSGGSRWEVEFARSVHPYSPTSDLTAFGLRAPPS